MSAQRKCMCCKKTKVIRSRGQCANCFSACNRAVHSGETTWEKLEQAGASKPLKYTQTPFRKALAKSK